MTRLYIALLLCTLALSLFNFGYVMRWTMVDIYNAATSQFQDDGTPEDLYSGIEDILQESRERQARTGRFVK